MNLFVIIVPIIWGIVWGFATNKVIENKGYDENWFWWGFFFGIIPFLVAMTKRENSYEVYPYSKPMYPAADMTWQDIRLHYGSKTLADGDWRCAKCGRINKRYFSTFACGRDKSQNEAEAKSALAAASASLGTIPTTGTAGITVPQSQEIPENEHDRVRLIKEYKELADAGIITRDEFEAKKKQLLGLE